MTAFGMRSGSEGLDQLRFLTSGGHTDGTYGTGCRASGAALGGGPATAAAPDPAAPVPAPAPAAAAAAAPGLTFFRPRRPAVGGDDPGDRSADVGDTFAGMKARLEGTTRLGALTDL